MHLIKNVISFTLFLILFLTDSAVSQNIIDPDSALQIILENLGGSSLSLSQAQEYALKNAISVRQAEAVYLAALGSLRRERGFFDPEFYFNLYHQDLKEPTASFFAGADVLVTEQTTSQTGLNLKLPVGTQLELNFNTINLKTNSQFAFLNPQYNAFGTFGIRQPLLGGFTASGRKDLNRVEFEYEAAEARYNQEVIGINTEVEQTYWQLYTAERNYAVQKLSRDRAEAFLKETVLRNKAGLVGPNQVANARTFLAEQELLLIDQEERLDTQSDLLASLLGVRPEEGNFRYKVVDDPPSNFSVEPVEKIIDYAISNNLEIKASQKDIDATNSLVDAADWEKLPRVDLVGSLISSSVGGTSQDVIFGTDTLRSSASGSFGDVLNQAFKRRYPGWSVGIELSLPIGLRPGLGEEDRLEAQAYYVEQRHIELSRILEQQIRAAHRELNTWK